MLSRLLALLRGQRRDYYVREESGKGLSESVKLGFFPSNRKFLRRSVDLEGDVGPRKESVL